jgi:arginine deiminase
MDGHTRTDAGRVVALEQRQPAVAAVRREDFVLTPLPNYGRDAKSRAFMHLDTALTMIDRDAFVSYPYLPRDLRSYTITPDESPDGLLVEENDYLWVTVQKALDSTVLSVAKDARGRAGAVGPRQQLPRGGTRSDLRIRAEHDDQHLPAQKHRDHLDRRERAGTRPGSPRCMTCPIERDAVT